MLRGALKDETKYSSPDNDPRGPWMSDNMVGLRSKRDRPNLHYDILVGEVEHLPEDKGLQGLWQIGIYRVTINTKTKINQDAAKITKGSYVFAMGEKPDGKRAFDARYVGDMTHLSEGMPRPSNIYPAPDKGWRYEPASMARKILDKRILWPEEPTGRPRKKTFLKELKNAFTGFSTVVGYTRDGTTELDDIFGHEVITFPKPSSLVETLVEQLAT